MLYSNCLMCILRNVDRQLPQDLDESVRMECMQTSLRILSEAPATSNGAVYSGMLAEIYQQRFHCSTDMSQEKRTFNDILLKQYDSLQKTLRTSSDPVLTGLRLTLVGNYIDFGTMPEISEDTLMELMNSRDQFRIDSDMLNRFKEDLGKARSLVYLADNCGEIVLDKLMMETIRELYPDISITVIVRGAPVINDTTTEDAEYVGLHTVATVIGNGTCLPGTELSMITDKARSAIENADLIISKGLGNLESMSGCGLNVYYLFLSKCQEVARRFHLKPLDGIMVHESHNAFIPN